MRLSIVRESSHQLHHRSLLEALERVLPIEYEAVMTPLTATAA